MNKKVFLTGAAGFAGKPIAEYLHQRKFKVTKILFSHFKKKGIKIDLTKKILLKRDFDWIVHTASHHKIKDFKSKPKLKEKNNILMVKNLIQFSKKNKIKNFIYFSTIDLNYSPYPLIKQRYCQSKLLCEKILLAALRKKIFKKLIILRIPSIVKKNSGENFIINTLYKLKNDLPLTIWNAESKYNNLIHINDLSKLVFYLIKNTTKDKKIIINCLSSKAIILKKLVNYVVKKLNSKSEINFINKKNNFKIKKTNFFSRTNYKFFEVKKVIDLLI